MLFGTPVFKGTRVPATHLFDFFENGFSITQFREEFPNVQYQQAVNLNGIFSIQLLNSTLAL